MFCLPLGVGGGILTLTNSSTPTSQKSNGLPLIVVMATLFVIFCYGNMFCIPIGQS